MTFGEEAAMNDRLDVSMQDAEILDEIEITSNLMIAASETDGPLSQERIDRILGIRGRVAQTG
jgi:hypothetical protein